MQKRISDTILDIWVHSNAPVYDKSEAIEEALEAWSVEISNKIAEELGENARLLVKEILDARL